MIHYTDFSKFNLFLYLMHSFFLRHLSSCFLQKTFRIFLTFTIFMTITRICEDNFLAIKRSVASRKMPRMKASQSNVRMNESTLQDTDRQSLRQCAMVREAKQEDKPSKQRGREAFFLRDSDLRIILIIYNCVICGILSYPKEFLTSSKVYIDSRRDVLQSSLLYSVSTILPNRYEGK